MAAACAVALPATAATIPAPRMGDAGYYRLQRALPRPYRAGDATAAIAAARARAAKSGKRLLIDFGANWCQGCRLFAGAMALPDLHPFVMRHYEVVMIDIGAMDRNLAAAAPFGVRRVVATPTIVIVDPRTGRLVNRAHLYPVGASTSLQSIADWLARWA